MSTLATSRPRFRIVEVDIIYGRETNEQIGTVVECDIVDEEDELEEEEGEYRFYVPVAEIRLEALQTSLRLKESKKRVVFMKKVLGRARKNKLVVGRGVEEGKEKGQ